MKQSLDQQLAQTPSPDTGSRHATHSVGSAMSSAARAVCCQADRQNFSTPRNGATKEREGAASASMAQR